MLDRLISGAGALTDRADRLVRLFTSGRGPDLLANRPGSVIVIVLLIVAAIVFGLLAIEATDNPTPRTLAPADVAAADDLGKRVFATIEGVIEFNYVETYEDSDGDGTQDPDETGDAWYYFLVDDAGRGLTVRSTRHPDDIYRYTATGVVVRDPDYVSGDVARFAEFEGTDGIVLDDEFYLDARGGPYGSPKPLDLAGEDPEQGSYVTISGPAYGFLNVCSADADGDGLCEESEYDAIDWFIGDPRSGKAITVYQDDVPKTKPIEFTGMLRSEPASIRDAKLTDGLEFESLGLDVSDRYLLDDQASPANGALSMGAAIIAGLLAAVLAIGLAGGYLVFRRSKRPLPSGVRTLDPGEAIPLRVTGSLRRQDGLIHVREVDAQLVRFPLELPIEPATAPDPDLPETTDPGPAEQGAPVAWEPPAVPPAPPGPAASSLPVLPPDVPTTLIVERSGRPEGVALGRGELAQLMSGRVMRFRGPRPALRLVAGTGTLLLSFDSKEARDRAAGELIGESALLIQGSVAGGAR